MGIYRKYKNCIENVIFPAALFFYPFIGVCQGLDVADTTYSLANFQYFGQMDGTWMTATFLSNVWGSLLMCLPFGGTLIGMNCYTVLVQSAMALMVYLTFRKKMPAPLLFIGELIALGLCWAPSAVLYHYLTYFFMTVGILLLYCGLTEADEAAPAFRKGDAGKSGGRAVGAAGSTLRSGRQRLYFAAAGLCLGANVAVRMPNVVQAALILVVWYGIVLAGKKNNGCYGIKETKQADGDERLTSGATKEPALMRTLTISTGWCLAGYLAGFGIPFLAICLRYGVSAYPDMVRTLFAMTDKAVDYKPTAMLTGMFGDYGKGLYWLAFAGLCMAATGLALVFIKTTHVIIKMGYCLLLVVLLRFYWGRGMFTFRYYDYSGIYYPTVLLLLVTIGTAVFCLIKKDMAAEKKILAAAVLLEIFLTPLGSNNDLYPIINNLFLAVPFLLWAAYDLKSHFLWRYPLIGLVAFVLVQSIGFHVSFAFNDGVFGEPRDVRAALPEKAAGVWTNRENGALLEELVRFVREEGLTGRKVICYDEIPGLSYLLDMPPALSTCWPDLDSYRMEEYLRDMKAVETEHAAGTGLPIVIVSTPVAAYLSDDGEAISWFGVDMEVCAADEKLQVLGIFLRERGYTERFGNAKYVVYCAD